MKQGQKLKPHKMLEVLFPSLLWEILNECGDADRAKKDFMLCFEPTSQKQKADATPNSRG